MTSSENLSHRSAPAGPQGPGPRESPIRRERIRQDLAVRHLEVRAVRTVAPSMVRVTLHGPDLAGFRAPGPADHIRIFLPGPDGVIAAPTVTPDGDVHKPSRGTAISRQYTPLAFRPDAHELDLDFVVHGDTGPASAWAARATVGTPLVIAGPRGSRLLPTGLRSAVVVADETALPAAARWLAALPTDVTVTALLSVADPATTAYLDDLPTGPLPRRPGDVRWFSGPDRAAEVARALHALDIDPSTFVFLAGESGEIVPMRRHLRRELGLRGAQLDASGYWKRGQADLDGHAPLDPADPD